MKRFFWGFVLIFVATIGSAQVWERNQIPEKYTWNLNDIYATDADWEKARSEVSARFDEIQNYQGKLSKSPKTLLECLELNTWFNKELRRLETFAIMTSDTDTRIAKNVAMRQGIEQTITQYNGVSAFIKPEILTISTKKLESFFKKEPKLLNYKQFIADIQRSRPHLLSNEVEKVVANAGLMEKTPENVYTIFTVADFPYNELQIDDGNTILLDYTGFRQLRTSANRLDRAAAFDSYFRRYRDFAATIGTTLDGQVKKDMFYAQVRNYSSCLESALDENNVPVEVYYSLIDNVHKNLYSFHRYLTIKKRMLGVEQLKYSDLYAPVVKDIDLDFNIEEARQLNLTAFQILGDDYLSTVQKAYDERWIDYYPTPGKQVGAYSEGDIYDVHPYILLNYDGSYDAVSTMAHEIGHTMQSYLSNQNQPYQTAIYPIFVAEVASTLNEILLFDTYMKTISDKDLRLNMLMEYVDGFKSTLFRQTQFAEFELRVHEAAESGQQLTGESISEIYKEITETYYGHAKGICDVNDIIQYEWADIPHFYMNFYVFQYATSWTASSALAGKILDGDKSAIQKYLEFLSAGSSKYPIDLLKDAGVDMSSSTPFEITMKNMNHAMDEIDQILDKKGI